MSILQKGLGEIPAKDIVMDPFEAARRLGVRGDIRTKQWRKASVR